MGYSIERVTRSARLTITTADATTIVVENMLGDEGFRLNFDAKRTMDDNPGEFSVTLQNLPPDVLGALQAAQTRRIDDIDLLLVGAGLQSSVVAEDGSDALAAGFLVVELEAGYDGIVSRVFKAIGARVRSAPDADLITTITTITAAENLDGSLLGLPLQSFPAGAATFDLVNYLRQIAGMGPGNLSPDTVFGLLGDSKLDSPYHVSGGQAMDQIRATLQYLPLRWFIDDREIWLCGREGVSAPNAPPPWITDEIQVPDILLSPPQRDDGGRVVAECLLCPRLRPGRLTTLTPGGLALANWGLSPSLQQINMANVPPGNYRLDEVSHSGDTGDGPWTTKMLLRPILEAP